MINQHDRRDKKLLALDRERDALGRRYYISVALAEPVQRGWIRRYVLAEKIGGHKHRAMLHEILNVIGTVARNKTADFKKKRRRRKQRCVEIQQPLKAISISRWEKRGYPEGWKQYFRLELVRHKRLWHPTYVFAHRGLFELKVEPEFVTTVQVPDPAVAARLGEIDKWMRDRHLGPRLDSLVGHRRWRWPSNDLKQRKLSKLLLREMRETIEKYPEVDLAPCSQRRQISLWNVLLVRFLRRYLNDRFLDGVQQGIAQGLQARSQGLQGFELEALKHRFGVQSQLLLQ